LFSEDLNAPCSFATNESSGHALKTVAISSGIHLMSDCVRFTIPFRKGSLFPQCAG
jgi:hypothetical protein